jgi:starch-binding outer membrane protein, SusD/RagB family
MKKNIPFKLTLLFLLVASSCNDFLNREPISEISSDKYFTTIDEALGGIFGAYNELQNLVSQELVRVGTGSDEYAIPPTAGGQDVFIQHAVLPSDPTIAALWPRGFRLIQLANLGLAKIPGITEGGIETVRPGFLAELKALRALTYFYYVQVWRQVPLYDAPVTDLTDESVVKKAKSSEAEVYAFIEKDLREAISDLPEARNSASETRGRLSKAAARFILAKVLLTKPRSSNAEATEAIDLLNLIIANTATYELLPKADYFRMFTVGGEKW